MMDFMDMMSLGSFIENQYEMECIDMIAELRQDKPDCHVTLGELYAYAARHGMSPEDVPAHMMGRICREFEIE